MHVLKLMMWKGLMKGSKDSRAAGKYAPFMPQMPHFTSTGKGKWIVPGMRQKRHRLELEGPATNQIEEGMNLIGN